MKVREQLLLLLVFLGVVCYSYAASTKSQTKPSHHQHHYPKKPQYQHHHHTPKQYPTKQYQQSNAIQPHKPAKVEVFTKRGTATVTLPTYEFGYKIHDPHSKNYQEKSEVRLGDSVKGFYSVLQPNGQIRVVRYHSDDSGFHSKVSLHRSRSPPKS